MIEHKGKDQFASHTAQELLKQRMEWRKKGWSIPELKGGKQVWFSLIIELVELIGEEQANELDAFPSLQIISEPQSWRAYASFLKNIGIAENKSGNLCLSEEGIRFRMKPTKRHLADLLQRRIRLFGEALAILENTPATVEDLNRQLCEVYKLNWTNLGNIRRRMDWLEILDLIQGTGNRKWRASDEGKEVLNEWILVTPKALEPLDMDYSEIKIATPPVEIADLLRRLAESPELHKKRSTYNIWVPSPNRIENLRVITQVASERIGRADLFQFIGEKFNLKQSSVESMMPFLKVSGLIEEVGRNIYLATPAAKAWLGTGNDLDFIRILHSHMRFVGEMIQVAEKDIVRNDIYQQAKAYGLTGEKARWIVGFLLEAGLMEETQYLHLKATPMGLDFASGLPLAKLHEKETEATNGIIQEKLETSTIGEFDRIKEGLLHASRNPNAEGKAMGVALEENIADIFRLIGFEAERIGGAGDTDVVVSWQNDDGKRMVAIIDGKSKSSGQVSHGDISEVAIDTHKDKHNANFAAIIGPGFSGDTIKNHAKKKGIALLTDIQIIEIAQASQKLGLSLTEIALIFQVPQGCSQLEELIAEKQRESEIISLVVSRFCKEQETLGCLSPRDLFLLMRGGSLSPSLQELLQVFDILSKPEIGILKFQQEERSPETTAYQLKNARSTVYRLRALASAIEKGLYDEDKLE